MTRTLPKPARDDGGPAFPLAEGEYVGADLTTGMSLRDYFAARALPFCCLQHNGLQFSMDDQARLAAEHAYVIADAMIAARRPR